MNSWSPGIVRKADQDAERLCELLANYKMVGRTGLLLAIYRLVSKRVQDVSVKALVSLDRLKNFIRKMAENFYVDMRALYQICFPLSVHYLQRPMNGGTYDAHRQSRLTYPDQQIPIKGKEDSPWPPKANPSPKNLLGVRRPPLGTRTSSFSKCFRMPLTRSTSSGYFL